MSQRARKVDANHGEIRTALRDAGYPVKDVHSFAGMFDLLTMTRDGRLVFIEAKTPGGKLTDAERETIALFGEGAVIIAYSGQEAVDRLAEMEGL